MILMIIDASKGFVKDGKQNRLRACDIKRIADTYRERRAIPGYSREVSRDEIRRNDYNLNIPRYVDSSEAAVKYDIYSTMFGGIPENEIDDLQRYWDAFPTLRQELFASVGDRPFATIATDNVKHTILENNDVWRFVMGFANAFEGFAVMLHQRLVEHVETVREMEENDYIAADMFGRMRNLPLVDKYEAYQIIADHWNDIMGDVEIIQSEGFGACNKVEPRYKMVKDKNGVEQEVEDGEKGRIMPFELIQENYFQKELNAIRHLAARIEAINGEVDAVKEEFDEDEQNEYMDSEKEGALDKKKITAEARPKSSAEAETRAKLQKIVALWDEQSKTKKAHTKALLELNQKTKQKIESLDMKEINHLLDIKWIQPIGVQMTHKTLNIFHKLQNNTVRRDIRNYV